MLTQYAEISFDTLYVFPQDGFPDNQFKYLGTQLASGYLHLLPEEVGGDRADTSMGVFACFKFRIDSQYIGLITRTPAKETSSSVKLLVYDQQQNTITTFIQLAESWGDAGAYYNTNSWIYKSAGGQYELLQENREGYDHAADDPPGTTKEEAYGYYLLAFNANSIDTLNYDSSFLAKQFSHLLTR